MELITISDFKKIGKDNNDNYLGKTNPQNNYGCLMLDVNFNNWDNCLSIVNDDIVYDDEKHKFGKETEPHVTILFGFDNNTTDKNKLKDLTLDYINNKLITFNIIGLSYFEGENFDTLKFDIESEQLMGLNKLCKDNFKYSSDFPNYNAHLTISYIKKGVLNDKYKYRFDKPFVMSSGSFVYSSKINDNKDKFRFNTNEIKLNEETIQEKTPIGKFEYNQVLSPNPKSDLFIVDLEIFEQHRGKGLFKQFLNEIIKFAKSKGFNKILLEPDITKGSANTKFLTDLYHKYGFIDEPNEIGIMGLKI
jgi:2'-5' RNA ligase/GNAT superfamily N-acetyltransferase